ncbi:stereocilin-like [Asterias rubens]|uniref:stereocilin-like n=1 Tax=Asterias rubens TaxID=7604 RepID=UPI001455C86F|nr:stereocilin-like [Asterias rubens]
MVHQSKVILSIIVLALLHPALIDAVNKVKPREEDHRWHEQLDPKGHDTDVLDDQGLHNVVDDFQSIVNNFFGPDESGMPGFNMSAVMLSAEKQRHEMEMRGPYSQAGSFAREPLIPNAILKRLSPDIIWNMTAVEVFQLLQATEVTYESLTHILSNLRTEEFDMIFDIASSEEQMQDSVPDPTIVKAVIDACSRHWGPVRDWSVSQMAKVGPMLINLNTEQIKQLNQHTLPVVLDIYARLHYRGDEANTLVHHAMRLWGRINTWNETQLHSLGPLWTLLSPRDLRRINPDYVTSLLSLLGSYEFERGQARAIIKIASDLPDWSWTLEQVQSLGKLRKFMDPRELKAAPVSVFASPDMLEQMLPSGGREHQQQTKEIARLLKGSMDPIGTWDAEDFKSMGRSASGLDVNDLEQLDPSVVQGALKDIADAEFSPRQRQVLVEKYRKARGSLQTSMSAEDVREMKGLSVGLSTSDLAHMAPQDIRESVDIFAQNSKRMRRTQKREIIKQLKEAPGGIEDAIRDMGDMVKELPLKDMDSLCTANFTASADTNSTQMAAAGRMNWTEGQSMKLFRCFKNEVLGGNKEGSSADLFTPSTIRYMGSMAKGITCDDINAFFDDDILPFVSAMMDQDNWSPRQLDCIHKKVKSSLSEVHADYTADFSENEINTVTGQLLKEFSMEELAGIPESHCEMVYSEIGREDLIGLKRDKRRALASDSLKCLDKETSTIEQDTIDIIGNLVCDLDEDALRRLSAAVFTDNLYNIQKCCLDINQLEVIGEKLIQDIGSPNRWTTDTISDTGPLLVSLSQQEIQNLDDSEFSLVAEDVMLRFAEYKERWQQYCDVDLRSEDISRREEGFVAVAIKAKDAFVAAAAVAKRRKRNPTYSPTCNEIESLGEGNVAWTVEELQAMTVNTFDSCGYALGEVSGFSQAQLMAVIEKAKSAWGEAALMAADQVSQLGYLASGFTASEINQLNLTEIDTVYAIAQYNIYTAEQLSAGVGRYLELSGSSMASLDSLDLTALGNFLCGLTVQQMQEISSDAYMEAANAIGDLQSCDTSQWAILLAKAVEGYGSITTWMPEVYSEVGSVIAGFSSQELSSLSDASLAGIKPHAISLIEPQTLAAGWNPTQLTVLDRLQAEAITPEQLAALSQDQRNALLQAEYGDDVNLAEDIVMQTTQQVHVLPTLKGGGASIYHSGMLPAFIVMYNLLYRFCFSFLPCY